MAETADTTVEEIPATEPADTPTSDDVNFTPELIKPDLQFKETLAEFGSETLEKCYQCATCTAVCELSNGDLTFPRKEMVWAQWGLKDRLIKDPNIWECYYCGDCSKRCPRGANPGELMMSLRRYAISRYDWTGLSRLLYTSRVWEIGALLFVAAIVVLLFALSGAFTAERMPTDTVSVETFIPHVLVHWGDWVMAGILTFFLLTNSFRMVLILLDGQKVPLSVFITEAKTFIIHMATQKRWRECKEKETRIRWFKHFFLVTGYVTMFTMVMFFLGYLQQDTKEFHWTSLLGYYATAAILFFSADAIISRLRKKEEIHKHSHDSDWMFLILLFLTGLTGIMMNIFRLMDWPLSTYYIYVIHLAIAVPMLVVEVPFGKWAHLMYRPLALYIRAVKTKAGELEAA